MLNLGLIETWIGNGFLNLFHANNHVLANGVEANNNFFTKIECFNFVTRTLQVVATCCVGLC